MFVSNLKIMKELNLLKTILDIFWVLLILSVIGIFVLSIAYLTTNDISPIIVKSTVIEKVDVYSKALIVFQTMALFLFAMSIYYLRKLVSSFYKMQIFTDAVILYFKRVGQTLIGYAVISNGSIFVYNVVERTNSAINFSVGSYDSFLVIIALGLFFIVLSKVFTISKNIKNENDLTI